jgi:hypothetical protein
VSSHIPLLLVLNAKLGLSLLSDVTFDHSPLVASLSISIPSVEDFYFFLVCTISLPGKGHFDPAVKLAPIRSCV